MLARDPWARVTHGDIQVPSSALCGGIITVHHPDMDRAGAGELDRVAMCVCVFVCVFFFFWGGGDVWSSIGLTDHLHGAPCVEGESERDGWFSIGLRDRLHRLCVEGETIGLH